MIFQYCDYCMTKSYLYIRAVLFTTDCLFLRFNGRIWDIPAILTVRYFKIFLLNYTDSKVHGANMGPTWVLSAPGGPHIGPMNLAVWVPFFIAIAGRLSGVNIGWDNVSILSCQAIPEPVLTKHRGNISSHYDIMSQPTESCWSMPWWRHQMEIFTALLAICAGNSPETGEFPTQSQWRGALIFSLICVWINGWVNNREAGDLRRYRAHYDVSVMHPSTSIFRLGCCPCPLQWGW